MSDSDHCAQIYESLRELSKLVPEMRCAQLLAAISELCEDLHGRGLWDATDAELLEAIWQFRRNYEAATIRSSSAQGSAQRAVLTFDWLGEKQLAKRLEDAIARVINEKKVGTYDVGMKNSTTEVAQEVAKYAAA